MDWFCQSNCREKESPPVCLGRRLFSNSLRALRQRIPAFVQALRRYCTTVRLPVNVHVGLLDHVLLQPALHNCMSGVDGISRFSRVKFPCMLGVFDRAEPDQCSRFRISPVLPSARWNGVGALISDLFHGSITLPACSPVNASRAALRLPAHDSGPGWLATPYLYDSCIRDFTPVYPGALQLGSKPRLFWKVF